MPGVISDALVMLASVHAASARRVMMLAMGMDLVELMMLIEDHFGVTITSSDLDQLCRTRRRPDFSVGQLHGLIVSKLKQPHGEHAVLPHGAACQQCHCVLAGAAPIGECEACGAAYDMSHTLRDWEAITRDAKCLQCAYALRGLPPVGACPECGRAYDLINTWPALCGLVEGYFGMLPGKIEPDTLMVADLGLD